MIMKTKLVAWILALSMAVSAPALALAEQEEKNTYSREEIIELIKPSYEINDPNYDTLYEYRYVSEDGKSEKWIMSREKNLDDWIWTEEKRPTDHGDYNENDEPCDIKEEHAHMHIDLTDWLMIPVFNDKEHVYSEDKLRLRQVIKISKEAVKFLNDYNVYALSHNIFYMDDGIGVAMKYGGIVYLDPQGIKNDVLNVEAVLNDTGEAHYTNDMSAYLIKPEHQLPEYDKKGEFVKQLSIPKVTK